MLPQDERRRKLLKTALSVAGAAILLYLLFRAIDWNEAWGVLRRLSPKGWLAVLGVHAAVYVLRTMRFAALIPDRRVPFLQLWSIQSANQMASLLLPLRTGEITYPIYLRNAGVPLEVGVAGLIVSRALDLLAVLTITVASALWLGTPLDRLPRGAAMPLILILATAAGALLAVATGGAPFIRACATFAGRLGVSLRVLGRVEQVARGFETVGRYRALAEAFALTLLIWVGVDVFYYVLMDDLGFSALGPIHVAFGASAAILTNLLPLNTFAGFGTQEFGWTWGFEQLGVTKSSAAASGLAVHIVQLVNVAAFGILAHRTLGMKPRAEQTRVLRRADRDRAALETFVRSIPEELAQRRPSGGGWCVAEIADHLARTEESIAHKMKSLLATPGDVAAGRRVRVPIAIVALRVPAFRVEAPSVVRPAADVPIADALARLARSRERLRALIEAHDDSVLRGKRFGHPLLGALDLLEWVEFIRYHERRHAAQMRAVLREVRGASPAPTD